MPSKVRIISPKNSLDWDDLVRAAPLRRENTYGGIVSNERADKVRRSIRTAAKHLGLAGKVYWHPCPDSGKCKFGDDCAFHVEYTMYTLAEGQAAMAARAKQREARR